MLDHIYFNPKLENHESVRNFANIKGVNRNMYFVDHEESEVGLTFTKWNTPLMCSCQYYQYNANYVQRQRLEGTRKAPKRIVRSWGGGGGVGDSVNPNFVNSGFICTNVLPSKIALSLASAMHSCLTVHVFKCKDVFQLIAGTVTSYRVISQ